MDNLDQLNFSVDLNRSQVDEAESFQLERVGGSLSSLLLSRRPFFLIILIKPLSSSSIVR